MNSKNIEVIQNATLKSLTSQIFRTLSVARIKGWEFPDKYDVGVTIVAATALATKIKARMDDVTLEGTIESTDVTAGVVKITDDLVAEWLVLHATGKPAKKRRAAP